MNDRLPPQAVEVEALVLGALLFDANSLCNILDVVIDTDFYKPAHQIIFRAMVNLFEKRNPIDLITVSEELKRSGELEKIGGEYYLTDLSTKVSSSANITYHAHIVLERSLSRNLIHSSTEIIERAYSETEDTIQLLEEAEQKIFSINQRRISGKSTPLSKALLEYQDKFEKRRAIKELSGVATGYYELDEITAGLQPSNLIIIAGRPSQGKTALALSMSQNIAKKKIPVGFFSLEMSTNELVTRTISALSKIDGHRFRVPHRFSDNEVSEIVDAIHTSYPYPLYIDDSASCSILELRAKARRMFSEHKIKIMFVDYLQLLMGNKNASSREQEVSSVSRGLKAIAKDLDIPVVALSQLNRLVESRSTKRPMLSDLRESGAIEQDADVVIFTHRPEMYNEKFLYDGKTPSEGLAELIIAKQRNGAAGEWLPLQFAKQFTRYENPAIHNEQRTEPAQTAF